MLSLVSNTRALLNQSKPHHYSNNENIRSQVFTKEVGGWKRIDKDVNFVIQSFQQKHLFNDHVVGIIDGDLNLLYECYQHIQLPIIYLKRITARGRRRTWLQYDSTLKHILLQEEIHPRGLPNHGYTCYLNAILQSILSPISFFVYLHRIRHVPVCKYLFQLALYVHYDGSKERTGGTIKRGNVHHMLKNIMKYVQKSGQFQFNLNEQHDAQELLHALMDCVLEQSGIEHCSTRSASVLSEGQPCDEKENDLLFHHYINAMKSIASYEREQSDHRSILKYPQQKDKDNREEAENSLTLQYYELKQKIPSIERMIARTNSYCATPFSGTIQSTLECSVCHHMKKSNSSFLEIPIVPMELSRIGNTQKHNMETVFQICTLQDCLDEFVADETIHDYNCLSCSLILERKRLDEEEMMTRDAIMFQMRKKHQDDGKPDSEVVGLEHELNEILSRREFLSTVDPNDDENERIKNINDYDIQCHIRKFESIPKPRKVNMIKRLHILQLPPILCFHVKRLYYDTHSKRMNKSVQHVQFGEFFDANCLRASDKSETLDDQCNYRLMSVVVHTGNAYSGHYFTYRRANHADIYRKSENGKDDKTWVMVSDETLTYVSWNQVSRCEAYLLVYELF